MLISLQVGTSDDRVRIYNAATGEMVWQGSALGTAYGILVRDVLVRPFAEAAVLPLVAHGNAGPCQ